MKKETQFHIYTFSLVAIAAVFIAYLYLLDPFLFPAVRFEQDATNLKTEHEVYHPGDTVRVHMKFCKLRNSEDRTTWNLSNGITVATKEGPWGHLNTGCYPLNGDTSLVEIGVVPLEAPTAEYRYFGVAEYRLWSGAVFQKDLRSEPFRVERGEVLDAFINSEEK